MKLVRDRRCLLLLRLLLLLLPLLLVALPFSTLPPSEPAKAETSDAWVTFSDSFFCTDAADADDDDETLFAFSDSSNFAWVSTFLLLSDSFRSSNELSRLACALLFSPDLSARRRAREKETHYRLDANEKQNLILFRKLFCFSFSDSFRGRHYRSSPLRQRANWINGCGGTFEISFEL